jgi:hypothetical protein
MGVIAERGGKPTADKTVVNFGWDLERKPDRGPFDDGGVWSEAAGAPQRGSRQESFSDHTEDMLFVAPRPGRIAVSPFSDHDVLLQFVQQIERLS